MGQLHTGYFAVPAEHLDELRALDKAWKAAASERREDKQLFWNRLYERAAEVAVYQRSLPGLSHLSASGELSLLFSKHLWNKRRDAVFSPEDCERYYERLLALEERRGGEVKLAHRVKTMSDVTPDMVLEVYKAFKDVLGVAAERGLGFADAVYEEDVEAELAEERRQREERNRNFDEWLAGRPPQSPEEIEAEFAAWRERFPESPGNPMTSAAAREPTRQAVLCLLSDADADEIRALLFEVNRLWAEEQTIGRFSHRERTERRLKARWLAYQRATSRIALPHRAEAFSLTSIVDSLIDECFKRHLDYHMLGQTVRAVDARIAYYRERPDRAPPPSSLECYVFSSLQAAILGKTLATWERERGRPALVAGTMEVHRERALAESALAALETALADAERQGLALVCLVLDRDELAVAKSPEPPPPPVR